MQQSDSGLERSLREQMRDAIAKEIQEATNEGIVSGTKATANSIRKVLPRQTWWHADEISEVLDWCEEAARGE